MDANLKTVTHVIFDVDGLLLDTERLYTEIMTSLCETYGKKFTVDIKLKQMGHKEHESGQILIDELDLPITVDEYVQIVRKKSDEYFPHAKLLPGAEKLVRHLHKQGIPIALATGGDSVGFEKKTREHGEFFSLFHHIVFSSEDPDVHHGKPAPDCFLVCADRFPAKPDASQILVFEDAPNGVRAAHDANMKVVWVPDHYVDLKEASHLATLTLNSLVAFEPEAFGLPPF